jgi:hypothetical protein
MEPPTQVKAGDVIGVAKDMKTVWKGAAELWYAYVQAIEPEGGR